MLAACRRERSSSHASRSGRARVLHGTGRERLKSGRRQNRVGDDGRIGWKEAAAPVLRPG